MADTPNVPSPPKDRTIMIGSTKVHLVCHKVGNMFSCHVDNIDPGAVIGRAMSGNREEAEEKAISNATAALGLQQVRDRMAAATTALKQTLDNTK